MPRAFGQVTTSAGTKAAIENTAYTEQTSNAQRSVGSSSANDAAAGTGARTVRITYFSWDGTTMLGPFTETVALNGTTPVNTVGTNICFIEKMEVLSVGSGGVAAGTISLFAATAGGGGTIGTIATGAIATAWAHHYIGSKYQCRLTDMLLTGGNATQALFEVDVLPYPSGVEKSATGAAGAIATTNGSAVQYVFPDYPKNPIPGPARLRAYVTPGNATAQTSYAGIGYVDEKFTY